MQPTGAQIESIRTTLKRRGIEAEKITSTAIKNAAANFHQFDVQGISDATEVQIKKGELTIVTQSAVTGDTLTSTPKSTEVGKMVKQEAGKMGLVVTKQDVSAITKQVMQERTSQADVRTLIIDMLKKFATFTTEQSKKNYLAQIESATTFIVEQNKTMNDDVNQAFNGMLTTVSTMHENQTKELEAYKDNIANNIAEMMGISTDELLKLI